MKELDGKEAMAVNEFIKFNNEYVGLNKQKIQYEMAIKNINSEMKNIKAGVGFPLIKAIGKNIFVSVARSRKNEVIKEMQHQRSMLQNSLKGIEGQMLHKSDEYEGAALKVYRFLYDRFKDIKMGKAKSYEMPSVKEKDEKED
jgi:uncharacterized FlaG/YvyC family protein